MLYDKYNVQMCDLGAHIKMSELTNNSMGPEICKELTRMLDEMREDFQDLDRKKRLKEQANENENIYFEKQTIDLYGTCIIYEKETGEEYSKHKWLHSFGNEIFKRYYNLIANIKNANELIGIRKCLMVDLEMIESNYITWMIIPEKRKMGIAISQQNQTHLLASSLILSIIEHEQCKGTYGQLKRGFELACLYAGDGQTLKRERDWYAVRNDHECVQHLI